MHLPKPTKEGVRRWPPDGYLQLNPEVDVRRQVACTCTAGCGECRGECGCEACELGWLVYQDDQALWSEDGDLVNVIELGTAWKRVADPRQLRLRFQAPDMEPPRSADNPREEYADATEPPDLIEPVPDDHLSVPPIYHEPGAPLPPSADDATPGSPSPDSLRER